MKLIFSPYFDKGSYTSSGFTLGEKTVGPAGLLDELELRTGTAMQETPAGDRVAHYYIAIKKTAPEKRFYKESFKNDPLGVSAELLKWRDALVLNGWNSSIRQISDKLDDLADIEEHFSQNGPADRWINILSVLEKDSTTLPDDMEIKVLMRHDLLEPTYRKVLDAVEKKGVKIEYSVSGHSDIVKEMYSAGKISVKSFHDVFDASEWAANHISDYTLAIVDNGVLLNDYLKSAGQPQISAEADSCNSEILQIFKLAYAILKSPANIYDILAFLNLKVSPIDGKLSWELSSLLIKEGGFSENWGKTIFDYYNYSDDVDEKDTENKAKKKIDEKEKKRREKYKDRSEYFLNIIKNYKDQAECKKSETGVRQDVLKEFTDEMMDWVNTRIKGRKKALEQQPGREELVQQPSSEALEREISQMQCLNGFFKTMLILIEQSQGEIEYKDLDNWVKFIYNPGSFTVKHAEQNSIDTISDMRGIADKVSNVLWVDCSGIDAAVYTCSFLNPDESRKLHAFGIEIPSRETCTEAYCYAFDLALLNVDHLTICAPGFGIGNELDEHPLITELKKIDEDALEKVDLESERLKEPVMANVPGKKAYYELDPIDTDALKRKHESYSSLDTLIQHPFEYVLQYFADLKVQNELDDMRTTQGTTGHKYIETLFAEAEDLCGEDRDAIVPKFRELHENDKDSEAVISKVIQKTGLILDLKENKITRESFIKRLHSSVDALIDILEKNELSFVGCEVEKNTDELEKLDSDKYTQLMKTMQSRIDLVCKDKEEKIYIIDLKWSRVKRYKEKIENSQDLQLAYYKHTIELKGEELTGKVAAYAYFILTTGDLLVPEEYTCAFKDKTHIMEVHRSEGSKRLADEILEVAFNSYKFRMEQLKEGKVEEAEGMPLADLNYPEECFPLYPDFNDTKKKGYAYDKPNRILKGDLK